MANISKKPKFTNLTDVVNNIDSVKKPNIKEEVIPIKEKINTIDNDNKKNKVKEIDIYNSGIKWIF